MRLGRWGGVLAWMLAGWAGTLLRAQAPLAPPAPLVPPGLAAEDPAGAAIVTEAAASRALEMGFPSVAATLYAGLIAQPDLTPATQARLVLGWTIALLEDGRVAEAQAALTAYAGPRDARYELRIGLAAIAAGDTDAARASAERLTPELLPAAERSWLFYLRGLIADAGGDAAAAREAFGNAIQAAPSELLRARFLLAELRSRLRAEPLNDAQLSQLAQNVERFQGRPVGYDYAKRYAAVLAALGRRGDAVAFLQRQLVALPSQEHVIQDDFRLLLGLIAGATDGVGRNALMNVLASGADPEKQRLALHLLAQGLTGGPSREAWRGELSRLIALEPPHPIRADLLLYRAELALADNRYADAEQDAQAILERFPGRRGLALSVLIRVAWERQFYREVARRATEARELLAPGTARAQLGVLIAEAFFRARDYRSAANAYGAALAEVPPGVEPGDLMFQEVVAHLRAGSLDEAARRLDELAGDPDFDVINRWQAEWNLARALQAADRVPQALQRIDALLTDAADVAPPTDLAVRLGWLQARLALDAGEPQRALELAPALRTRLAQVAPDLRAEVASSLALLEAEANFALERGEEALLVLRQLRDEHPNTDAAVYSYLVEADAYAASNQLVQAQALLIKLVNDFPQNRYAPWALYEAALYAERRGQDNYMAEAVQLIERLVAEYPQSELVFYARFKQGDLLRKLNQFGSAVQIYEELVNNHAQHRDVLLAELAKADCYAAQAAGDATRLESAIAIYERLQALPAASLDLRAEAGFKRGHWLQARSGSARAQAVWWEAVNAFLLSGESGAQLGATGRFWLARTLLELARSLEATAKFDEARNAYELILQQGLPGASLARAAVARFTGGAPVEPGR